MNTFHLAVKLSVISEELLFTLLEADVRIIVDAEYDRLDHWVRDLRASQEQLKKMIFTVQVSRKDAEEQMKYFQKNNLDVLLVKGHGSYIDESDWSISKLSRLWDDYSCAKLLGITKFVWSKMQTKKLIKEGNILELLGYQKIKGSRLYTYLSFDGELSEAAKAYLSRRSGDGQFIVRSGEELDQLKSMHNLVYYIDHRDDLQYIRHFLKLVSSSSK